MNGVYTTLEELVALRFLSKRLACSGSRQSFSVLSGTGKSPFKGRGIDFEEVRIYQPGDDIRSIDWRVTARRSKPHTKIFREERERPVFIIIDQSYSMFFGSQVNFKSVTAADTCGLLAWHTLLKGDRIGGIVFNENKICEIKPQRSKKTIMRFLQNIVGFNQELLLDSMPKQPISGYLAKAFQHTKRVTTPGTLIYIISDFKDLNPDAIRYLSYLSKHSEIVALQVTDPLELELPKPGFYTITNGTHKQQIDTHNTKFRNTYRQQQTQVFTDLKDKLIRYKIRLFPLMTNQNTSDQLLTTTREIHGKAKHS